MRKEIVVLNEEVEKDWQNIAQQWCDIFGEVEAKQHEEKCRGV